MPAKWSTAKAGTDVPGSREPWTVGQFRRLLDRLPAGAYMCDSDGLITYFNQMAVELWGRAPRLNHREDRFCGASRLYAPDGSPIPHDRSWMAQTLQTNRPCYDREVVVEQPDGRRLTVLAHTNPLHDDRGALVGAVNVLIDITERRASEEEQQRLHEALVHMGRLSIASEMIGGIAHELNQPLTAITNYCEACLNLLSAQRPDATQIADAVGEMRAQAQRAGEIIRGLRDFTRRRRFQQVAAPLERLFRGAAGLTAARARDCGAGIRIELPEVPVWVEVDPVQVKQVLVNLLHNALEAVGQEPADSRVITLSAQPPRHGWVTVLVSDTGSGIPEDVRDHLFHPFVTTRPDGMGLGLSISRSIVEAHGGRIWEEHAGSGTTFRFTLPAARAGAGEADGGAG